jgi:hypothetical protein
MKLKILTFTNKELDKTNRLVSSCNEHKLSIEVIIEKDWQVNAQKIKLLFDYLNNLKEEAIILVTNAFDVLINGNEDDIISAYKGMNSDILFSAEANFYFRNRKLLSHYHKNYPESSTIYRYLNSGTFIGTSSSLREMLADIIKDNKLKINNLQSLIQVRSDQYLYGKIFVDNSIATSKPIYNITLDYNHQLFEVTGGRMRILNLPYITNLHAFNGYKVERFLMKFFKLNELMDTLTDLKYNQQTKQFYNQRTNTNPLVIHIPGSWKSFEKIIDKLMTSKRDFQIGKIPASFLSLLAYLISFLIPFKIKV